MTASMQMARPDEAKQRLRLRRFFLASTFSVLYIIVLALYYTQDKVDAATLRYAAVLVAAFIVAFLIVFKLRLNLVAADPSLTAAQVLAAMCTMLFVLYRAPETRLVFGAFFFVALTFGMLRSNAVRLTILGAISLAAYAGVTLSRYQQTGDADVLRTDMLQFLALAIACPWFVFVGWRAKRMNDADRRKDDFLATLAHELRNPLAPIRTGVQILQMTMTGPQAQTTLPMMERQLQHITRLLDDLLDVSRVTRGKIALQLERTRLDDAVSAAVEAARPLFEEMGHALDVRLPSAPVLLKADPVRLAQIFTNLLNNAAKYTPAPGRIALIGQQRDGEIEITVSDNGIGIAPERLHSIFDMFNQGDNPASRAKGGLGIGLALVRALVTLHGGSIEARSEGAGRGSQFVVRLPALREAAVASVSPQRASAATVCRKILVVDDSHDAAASLATLLKLKGHETRTAFGGDEALAVAAEWRPSVVLLDLGMPDIDGLEVCRRIRSYSWGSHMVVIAISGWGQDEDRRRSRAAGFDGHLVKPVSAGDVEAVLGKVPSLAR